MTKWVYTVSVKEIRSKRVRVTVEAGRQAPWTDPPYHEATKTAMGDESPFGNPQITTSIIGWEKVNE